MELTNREKYLLGISWKEKIIRDSMDCQRGQIKQCKKEMKTSTGIAKSHIKWAKARFTEYRHELHRIKGMDRVVIPKDVRKWEKTDGYELYGDCCCDNDLNVLFEDTNTYCSYCGRRVLWKVSEQ